MSSNLISYMIAREEKCDLILVEDTADETKFCLLCHGKLSVPYYEAKEKDGEEDLYVHKACGDLPLEMEHQQHSGHTIRFCEANTECSVCEDHWHYGYGCTECKGTGVCIRCALKLFPITHKYHPQHPLIPIHDDDAKFNCHLCANDYSRGISYKCTTCSFHVHQRCIPSSSRIIKLPFHCHGLKLIYSLPESGEPICCEICQGDMKEESCAYHCAQCNSFFHVHNCRHIVHFSHDHPLAFVEEEEANNDPAASGNCYACVMKITVPYYYCTVDDCKSFILHKSCAELPEKAEHHLHPGHTLELSKELYESICDACDVHWEGFSYSCCAHDPSCPFTIDIICAGKALLHKHKFHKHPLIPSPVKGPFACHACDGHSDGQTFKCTTCRFWVHLHCASLPMSRKYDIHPHELKLIYSLPDSLLEDRKYFRCNVCKEAIKPHNWAYHCDGCRHFIHVYDCRKIGELDPNAILANAVHLPVANESVSLATICFMGTNKHEEANELESKPQEDSNGTKARPMLFLDPKKTCGKCEQFLAAPCNNCALCKYFLPMPLRELMKWDATLEGYLSKVKPTEEHNCRAFTVDYPRDITEIKISGSVLPRYVKHEGHDHVLSTTYLKTYTWCNACEIDFTGYGFRCSFCGFTIDTKCALFPGSMSHKYDKKHPFKLTYFSIEGVKEYVCEICEEDITTMWFYHCAECDQSIHPRCIWNIEIMFGPFLFDPLGKRFTLVPATSTSLYKCRECDGTKTSECHYTLYNSDNKTFHLECIPKVEGRRRRSRKPLCGMQHNI